MVLFKPISFGERARHAMCDFGTFGDFFSGNHEMMNGGAIRKAAKTFPKNVVGSRIRLARQRYQGGLTQDQLSGRLATMKVSIDRPAITKIENGIRHVYDFELVALADALKVDVRWLLGIEP